MGMIYAPSSIIPNGALINNVCHIYYSSTTPGDLPLTRPDGSPLAARDRWYNTVTGEEAFYNGTYWLSTTEYCGSGFAMSMGYQSLRPISTSYNTKYSYYITRISLTGYLLSSAPTTQYFTISTYIFQNGSIIYNRSFDTRSYGADFNLEYIPNVIITPNNLTNSLGTSNMVYIEGVLSTGLQTLFLWTNAFFHKVFK